MREGVYKPDIDPVVNPLYRDLLAHYGVTALPARVRYPDRKGKVERAVGHAKNTSLKGERFESLEEAQAYRCYTQVMPPDKPDNSDTGPKKRQDRVAFAAPVQIKAAGQEPFVKWFAKNLSPGGIFIQTLTPFPVGQEVSLTVVTIQGDPMFEARTRVAWIRPPKRGAVGGMGLQFVDFSPENQAMVDRICEVNPPERRNQQLESSAALEAKSDPVESSAPSPQQTSAVISDIVLGIDLGTTNSCVAFVKDGQPRIVPTDRGYSTIPSVVTIATKGVIVGRAALDRLATHPKETVYGSKRLLGRKFGSPAVKDALKYFSYDIVPDANGDTAVQIRGETYSMTWVSARILEEIVGWAREYTQEYVAKVVITVPAFYTDRQRQAVMAAAEDAKLQVLQIVNEPTAAAVAYGLDRGLQQRILVYDLGGGTFDVSLLNVQGNVFEVLATGGDRYLGGVDFDNRIVDWLIEQFKNEVDVDLGNDTVAKLRIRQAAEAAKRVLSEQKETRVHLPYVTKVEDRTLDLDIRLGREVLNKLVMDLVERTIDICLGVLRDADVSIEEIDEIILVGGQTRMPLVQGKVHSFLGRAPRKGVHPDEAIALGAALLADSVGGVHSVTLLDVVSLPIGVALPGSRFKPVIDANMKLPAEKTFSIATTRKSQKAFSVDVYQGNGQRVDENEYLGTVELTDLPPRPKGEVRIEVEFRVDTQGFLTVSVQDSVRKSKRVVSMTTRDAQEAPAPESAYRNSTPT